jgi:uncharacterized RDD family membrane protein YckC
VAVAGDTMSDRIEFETPDNVQVGYEPAGLGTRFVAWFADNIILLVLEFCILFGLVCTGIITDSVLSEFDLTAGPRVGNRPGQPFSSAPRVWLYFVSLCLLIWGLGGFVYYGACELFMRGQTPGKRLSSIRVVRLDGFSLEPGSIFVRNIFRVVDHLPPLWIVPLVSRKSQRLGDMVAGTVVVIDKPEAIGNLREVLTRTDSVDAKFSFDAAMLKRLRPGDIEAVERILERWNGLAETRQELFLKQLSSPLAQRMQCEAPAEADRLQFLRDLLAAEYRRQHRGLG